MSVSPPAIFWRENALSRTGANVKKMREILIRLRSLKKLLDEFHSVPDVESAHVLVELEVELDMLIEDIEAGEL